MNNFHDAGSGHLSASEMFWLSNVLGKPMLTSARLNQMQTYNSKGSALDLLWYDSSITSTDFTLPKTAYFRGTEAVTMRGEWGNANSPWLSFHAGKANDNHSHLDCGTFVFDSMNVRWAMDLGSDDYTLPGYFGNQRWEYYRLRAEGHNTLVINPDSGGGQDLDADTPITQFVGRDNNPYSIIDLSSAYKTQANSVRRGLMMTDGMQGMLVRDEMDLKSNATVYWFMHTSANATVNADNTVTLEKNNKKMKLRFVTDAPNAWISVADAQPLPVIDSEVSSSGYPNDPNQSQNNGVRKIMIKLKGSGKINLSVQLLPEGQTSQANLNLSLNQWN